MKFCKQNFLSKQKIALIILVRLNSKRLKKKALLKIHNITVIELLIKRLLKKYPSQNIFICTDKRENKELKILSKQNNINFFRGDEKNIFKRIIKLRKIYKFNHFVRITGDNPFTNTFAIHKMSLAHINGRYDYTYTNSLPIGTRPEIISFKALVRANKLALDPNSSEYMTYFFKREIFKIKKIYFKKKHPKQNFFEVTIDKMKDLKNIRKNFSQTEIFLPDSQILDKICKINKNFVPKITLRAKIKTSKYDVSFINNISNKILD